MCSDWSPKCEHLQCLKCFPNETLYEVVSLSWPTFSLTFKLMPENSLPFDFPMKALLVSTDSKIETARIFWMWEGGYILLCKAQEGTQRYFYQWILLKKCPGFVVLSIVGIQSSGILYAGATRQLHTHSRGKAAFFWGNLATMCQVISEPQNSLWVTKRQALMGW